MKKIVIVSCTFVALALTACTTKNPDPQNADIEDVIADIDRESKNGSDFTEEAAADFSKGGFSNAPLGAYEAEGADVFEASTTVEDGAQDLATDITDTTDMEQPVEFSDAPAPIPALPPAADDAVFADPTEEIPMSDDERAAEEALFNALDQWDLRRSPEAFQAIANQVPTLDIPEEEDIRFYLITLFSKPDTSELLNTPQFYRYQLEGGQSGIIRFDADDPGRTLPTFEIE